jgi:hypothetical protein
MPATSDAFCEMRVLHVDAGRGRDSRPARASDPDRASDRDRGGGPDGIHRLVARLGARPGVEQAVAGPMGSGLLEAAARAGVATITLPLPSTPSSWGAKPGARAAARLAREVGRWDLVHVHGSRALPIVFVALAASGAASRLVATRREEGAPPRPALWRRADLVLAVSDAVRDALTAAGVGAARIRVVGPGIDPGITLAAYRDVLGSWRRRWEHARWMERAGRTSRALSAGPSP